MKSKTERGLEMKLLTLVPITHRQRDCDPKYEREWQDNSGFVYDINEFGLAT
jgi:hypothetical protein